MEIIHIICRLNENDTFSIPDNSLEVNLTNKDKYKYTFWDNKNKNALRLPNFYAEEGLDLLYLSLFVYYADRIIKRDDFSDSWTRKIKLYIPVLKFNKWKEEKGVVEKLLSFLSGDLWEIEFRQRELNEIESKFKKKMLKKIKKSKKTEAEEEEEESKLIPSKFCMLSGGLDSLIGAIDLLDENTNIAFVGHYGGGKGVHNFQELVKDVLKKNYEVKEDSFFNYYAAPIHGKEETTRTRSLMFFSHAIVLASTLKEEVDLIVPENGLISLNIPLTNSRLGSSSTRTTHPYYMEMLQKLLNNLNINVTLINPCQFKTKGEMILNCKNKKLIEDNIVNTMSCSHPDQGRYNREKSSSHCGNCFPCIIRRAAIKEAQLSDISEYRDKDFKKGPTSINNLKAYKIGIMKHKRDSTKNFLRVQIAGPITKNHKEYKSVYERGMRELINLLDEYDG